MSEKEKEPKELIEPDSVSKEISPQNDNLITDADLLYMYEDATNMLKDDRKQTDDVLQNFINMVMNEGDGSSASKEAICKLIELKLKAVDSFTKIAELKTRIKLKERDTFPAYLAQHNTYNIDSKKINRRTLLKELEQKRKANDKTN